jgi:hypothetical protein
MTAWTARQIGARGRPLTHDVGLVDERLPHEVLLTRGQQRRRRHRVGHLERPGGQGRREIEVHDGHSTKTGPGPVPD